MPELVHHTGYGVWALGIRPPVTSSIPPNCRGLSVIMRLSRRKSLAIRDKQIAPISRRCLNRSPLTHCPFSVEGEGGLALRALAMSRTAAEQIGVNPHASVSQGGQRDDSPIRDQSSQRGQGAESSFTDTMTSSVLPISVPVPG
jgi:hypothetical protein